ncbi:MAG: hypothetical protein RLZZ458_1727, partial [Planctomycetota bacterium]
MQECDFRHIVRLESVGFFHHALGTNSAEAACDV